MVRIRVIHLQEIRSPSPLHWPGMKDRRVGDVVALIDATPTQARRVSSNSAITPASAPHLSRTRTPRAFLPPASGAGRAAEGFGITWIGDDVMDHLVTNSMAIRNGDRVILAMIPSDGCDR
jgi:hypothetical protein